MKRIIMAIALCLVCAAMFMSCTSKEEKIAQQYIQEKDMPIVIAATALLNGEVVELCVDDFSNDPADTLFEWQVFEKYDLMWALEAYVNDMEMISDENNFLYEMRHLYGSCFDASSTMERIAELKEKCHDDSIAYAKAEMKHKMLQSTKEIRAIGYAFNEKTVLKIAGQTTTKIQPKTIYIMENGEVYNCIDRD